MSQLTIQEINSDDEKIIIIAMIMSTKFCHVILPIYKEEYFENEYLNTIVKWVKEYFDEHGEAPKNVITEIYKVEKKNLKLAKQNIIERFLKEISIQYSDLKRFKTDYYIKVAKQYFKTRSLEILFERGSNYVEAGRIKKADSLLEEFKEVTKNVGECFNPFSDDEINLFGIGTDISNEKIFFLDGPIGEIIGPLEREWLVSFTAPEKRGKTWLLIYFVVMSLLQGLKVFFISLEMNKKQIKKRLFQFITAAMDELEFKETILIPVFDCRKNQIGICKKKFRTCKVRLLDKEGEIPKYSDANSKYKVCTKCREDNTIYEPAIWFQEIDTNQLTQERISRKISGFKKVFKNNLRVITYPAFSGTFTDIKNELNDLRYIEGFEPDVAVIDYFDILGSENNLSDRNLIDYIWKTGKRFAAENNLLTVTVDQSNKQTYDRDILFSDTSEDKRKNAHLDVKFAINQTLEEHEQGIIRLSCLANRHRRVFSRKQAMITQSLDIGQPVLDSEIIWKY